MEPLLASVVLRAPAAVQKVFVALVRIIAKPTLASLATAYAMQVMHV